MTTDSPPPSPLHLCPRDGEYGVVNAVIETPQGEHYKYDLDPATGLLTLDRPIHTSLVFPANYGYLPETRSGDGDPLDILIIAAFPILAGAVVRSRILGIIQMRDEKGIDPKIIATIDSDPRMSHLRDIADVPPAVIDELRHFFVHIKDLEAGKWAEATAVENGEAARAVVRQSHLLKDTSNV